MQEAEVGVAGVRLDVVNGHVLHQPLELRTAGSHSKDRPLAPSSGNQPILNELDLANKIQR